MPGVEPPSSGAANPFKPRIISSKPRTDSHKPRAESAKPRVESSKPKAESSKPKPGSSKPKADAATLGRRRIVPRTHADSIALELAITKQLAHQPLAIALARRMRNPELADRVASAVVYEAGRNRLSPSLLAGVLLIENTPFDTSAVSTEGAIGLMQVMPVHVGSYGCLSGDLLNVEDNICHGARLLGTYLRRTKSMDIALRRYNGCIRGRNTPRCYHYPLRVQRTASRLRREILIAGARLADSSATARLVSSSRLGADLPPDIEEPDSASEESVQCSTLLGCLRRRWSR